MWISHVKSYDRCLRNRVEGNVAAVNTVVHFQLEERVADVNTVRVCTDFIKGK